MFEILTRFLLAISVNHAISNNTKEHNFWNIVDIAFDSGVFLKDPYLFWKLKPNVICKDARAIKIFGPQGLAISSFGIRDYEYSIPKKENTFRIVCLGGSLTWGFGVSLEDTYSKKLEYILNKQSLKLSKRFEVINAGIPGYTSFQGLRFLERVIIKLQPDIVIIDYGVNDKIPAGFRRTDSEYRDKNIYIEKLNIFLMKSKFYILIKNYSRYFFWRISAFFNPALLKKTRVADKEYFENLEKIKEYCLRNSIKPIFITQVMYRNGKLSKVFELPSELGIIINTYNCFTLQQHKEQLDSLFIDEMHLNKEGHEIIAKEIFNILINNNLI